MFNLFNKKRKYLDCPFMKHSLHFFHKAVCTCSHNAKGPVFYKNYKGSPIDLDFIYETRKKYIKKINSPFSKRNIPLSCQKCTELNNFLTDKKVENFNNKIDRVYFHNTLVCNAKCTYCTYNYFSRDVKYEVLPVVKEMIKREILSRDAMIYMSGGEITINSDFEELLFLLLNYLNSKIEILTSGIKYCKSIEEAFKKDRCRLLISIDSGQRETYKKIKQVDCFDILVDNIRNYIKVSENAKSNIILKYIIVDDVNDNIDEIEKFINLVVELGITTVRLDFDYEKYKLFGDLNLPSHYLNLINCFNELTQQYCLNVEKNDYVEAILKKKL